MAELYKCPHPECNHIASMITKVHCRNVHQVEREKIIRKYGEPKKMVFRSNKGVNKERVESK